MQNDRNDRDRDYSANSGDRESRSYIGYSAIPGPSFDTGRYVSDQRRDFSRNTYPSENRNRTFGESRGGSRYEGDDSYYKREQHYGSQGRGRDVDERNDRSRSDFYEMGGYGNSHESRPYGQDKSERGDRAYGQSARNSNWGGNINRGRDYDRDYGQSHYGGRSYSGPAYGSIPTGGRYDSDRDFTSGGITNMGGDYDREHNRGRQYRDNYDSAGTYIGDYGNRGGQDQDRNQYDSGFTFGSGSAGSPNYGHFNTGERYSGRNDERFGSYGAGNRSGDSWAQEDARYGDSGYSSRGEWNQPRSSQGNYNRQGTHTGSHEYDRRNYRTESYGRQRNGHQDDDRGFFDQAGDRLRSWFGGEDDERNRR